MKCLRRSLTASGAHDGHLVYNEGLDTDRPREAGPRSPLSTSRALIVKYTRTFGF